MLLNALSTCTMVRLGRVLGNRMIWVVPSNLKLIDRSTRYIAALSGASYEDACRALFEVIEYMEPRRRAGQVYPAPVGVATMRLRHGLASRRRRRGCSRSCGLAERAGRELGRAAARAWRQARAGGAEGQSTPKWYAESRCPAIVPL